MEDNINFLLVIVKIMHTVFLAYQAYEMLVNYENEEINKTNSPKLNDEIINNFEILSKNLVCTNDDYFGTSLGMSLKSFSKLLCIIKARLIRYSRRSPVPPETRLAITLFYLANGCHASFLAKTHNLGNSTVRQILYETCEAIWSGLKTAYVGVPSPTHIETIANNFDKRIGLPNCIGALEARILKFSRQGKHNLILLAVCDTNYIFRFVETVVEADECENIFSICTLGKNILENNFVLPPERALPGTNINFPYYFVANNSLPLRKNIMRPIPGYKLTPQSEKYNKTLLEAHEYTKNTFTILTNRWHVLQTDINVLPKTAERILLSTVALHNFLLISKDKNVLHDMIDEQGNFCIVEEIHGAHSKLQSYKLSNTNRCTKISFDLRNKLRNYLWNRK